jgi:beta-galactosidase/beta-glucuronidase
VARDKNHPCVVLWSIANEPESDSPASREYFAPLAAQTRELDSSRPVGFVNVMLAPPDEDVVTDLFDVVMLNRYYGGYVNTGDLANAEPAFEAELRAWAQMYDKPIIMTEYGGDTQPGRHSVLPTVWTEEYHVELLAMSHRVFDRIDAVVGEQVWNFADFATGPSISRVDGNKKGVFTRDRRPEAAAHHLRRRWRGEGLRRGERRQGHPRPPRRAVPALVRPACLLPRPPRTGTSTRGSAPRRPRPVAGWPNTAATSWPRRRRSLSGVAGGGRRRSRSRWSCC